MNIADFPDINFIDSATVDDVVQQMIRDYQDKYKELTGKEDSLAAANPYRLIMYSCAMQIYQVMQYADYAGKMSFLKYAKGEYLDNLAALRGVCRTDAVEAKTILKFAVAVPLDFAVSIPAGSRVTNGHDLFFATDEYAEVPAGKTEVTVGATCTVIGAVGNDFAEGELRILVNTLPYIAEVTNVGKTYGGADRENDESLRERIYSVQNSYSTAGPTGAYEYHIKNAASNIGDVVVLSEIPGEVDIYFICDDGTIPEKALMEDVKQYLDNRKIRPLTDKVIVRAPTVKKYDINMTYYISHSNKEAVTTIKANVETAVEIYNTWQTEKIGRDINPSYLIQKVMEAGAKRVVVESPMFTALSKSTVASKGTVTVNYGGVEDD